MEVKEAAGSFYMCLSVMSSAADGPVCLNTIENIRLIFQLPVVTSDRKTFNRSVLSLNYI